MLNVFLKLYRSLSRSPLPIVLAWTLLIVVFTTFALTGFGLGSVWNRTENRLVSIPHTESYRAAEILTANESASYQVYLLVDGVDMQKQHSEVLNVLNSATKNLQEIPGVLPAGVVHPFAAGDQASNPQAAELMKQFTAKNQQGFLMVTLLDLTQFPEKADEIRQMTETEMMQVAKDMRSFAPKARGLVSDQDLNNAAVGATAKTDTHLATLIAFGLLALVLFIAVGSLRLTLLVILSSFSGWALSQAFTNLASLFVAPSPEDPALVMLFSLGVVTGFALVLLSRARSHLAVVKYTAELPQVSASRVQKRRSRRASTGSPLDEVFSHSVRLLLISTGLMTLGLLAVAVFPATNLRWVAVVSILSIWGCFAIGFSLVPAMLYLAQSWLELPRPRWHENFFHAVSGFFGAVGGRVRDLLPAKLLSSRLIGVGVGLVVLLVLALPAFGVTWKTAGEDALPATSATGAFQHLRQAQYGVTGANPDVQVLGKTTSANLATWAGQVTKIPGISHAIVNPENSGDYAVLNVTFKDNLSTREAGTAVKKIRSLDSDFTKLVTGQTANEIDFSDQLLRFVPPLGAVMMFATFLVLARATRRPQVAFWATLLNLVVLLASLGVTAVIFQDGWGAFLPFLSKSGGIEPSVAVLLAGFGFALALDYQLYAVSKSRQVPGLENLEANNLLKELTQTRGALWTKSLANLAIFLAFLPVTAQAVKQPAFALAVAVLLNSVVSKFLLAPFLEPYPDQLPDDPGLIWKE